MHQICGVNGCPNAKIPKRGACLECAKMLRREKYAADAGPVRQMNAAWRRRNPEKAAAHNAARRERKQPTREQSRAYSRKNYYEAGGAETGTERQRRLKAGFLVGMFDACLKLQGDVCAICRQEFSVFADGRTTACADHEHVKPPVPRGVLCHHCNRSLGIYENHQRATIKIMPYEEYLENPPTSRLC